MSQGKVSAVFEQASCAAPQVDVKERVGEQFVIDVQERLRLAEVLRARVEMRE